MDEENDVYNYDTSFFFTLLDSKKYQSKFKLIQDQQGLVVCPLDVSAQSRNPLNQADLIDRHLFLPSPYLKNHFIPLIDNLCNLSPSNYLILDDSNTPNILIFKNGQRTCEYVKLLNIEDGYNDDNKVYKILIVNKEFNSSEILAQDQENSNFDQTRRYSIAQTTEQSLLRINNLSDVSTFGQSIDFMHNTVCAVSDYDIDQKRSRIYRKCIGDEYLEQIELFKKTYIILETHLNDCANNLRKIYLKYASMFINSFNLEVKFKSITAPQQADLIILIACEISIVGCLFAKLWPCVLKLNAESDFELNKKIENLKLRLRVDEFGTRNKKSIDLCKSFFQLNDEYFRIDFKIVLKELNKIALLNNPFERLQCIRVTIDLLSNEMTVLSLKEEKITNFVITSEVLIPLLAFILLLTNINCFKSIIYFIDTFSFSSQVNDSDLNLNVSNHKSQSLSYLAELNYFMTTFKAAVQFIEDS